MDLDILMSLFVSAEFLAVVKNFEMVRKSWLRTEMELKNYKELLVKSDVAKAALEIKLKHARNQLDVEMKKRHKIEVDYQYLVRFSSYQGVWRGEVQLVAWEVCFQLILGGLKFSSHLWRSPGVGSRFSLYQKVGG